MMMSYEVIKFPKKILLFLEKYDFFQEKAKTEVLLPARDKFFGFLKNLLNKNKNGKFKSEKSILLIFQGSWLSAESLMPISSSSTT